ncbi:MAG: dihydroxyacetone kinase [Pseudonocardia sp.]|jgi:dihydroxyacetone kinase-like protein|uniref:dihydroxyacetone kinase subunit DhaL n=1 Tax=Pseudonocardia sp. TaxID=60912 RepID=UPI0026361977|nr:dihydroxyacetone kinase subunit DhaL [Pseudonocardia sp.]MCU1628768.1 dihydroxyacetone kinase [Pseudonocardia sp.]
MTDTSTTIDGRALRTWLHEFGLRVAENSDHLTALDSEIGDADHGSNMHRGMAAVVAAIDADAGTEPGPLLKLVGRTLVSTVGGAAGPLYGTLFLRMAAAAGDAGPLDAAGFAKALRAGLEGVAARGRTEIGDKTMVDALAPAVDALEARLASGAPLDTALAAAAAAAAAGRDDTAGRVARKGRASYLGERSIGHQDPGSASATLLVEAAVAALGTGADGQA